MTPEHHPVFVYGTLRPGMSNHHWFRGKDTNRVDASISGYELVTNGRYPYLLPASPSQQQDAPPRVRGTLIFVAPEDWAEVAAYLDALEGTDSAHPVDDANLYNRVLHEVTDAHGTTHTAWVYIPPTTHHASLRARYPVVADGEWSE